MLSTASFAAEMEASLRQWLILMSLLYFITAFSKGNPVEPTSTPAAIRPEVATASSDTSGAFAVLDIFLHAFDGKCSFFI